MSQFEFNVPKCTTFSSDSDEDDVETYFDVDHESDDQIHVECQFHGVADGQHSENPTGLQADAVFNKTPKRLKELDKTTKTPRRSELNLLTPFTRLSLTTPSKCHPMETRQDSAKKNQPLELRDRKVSRMPVVLEKSVIEEEKVQRKRKNSVRNEEPEKFMCMAEAVERFHKVTPARFHTKPRNEKFFQNTKATGARRCTVAVSPHLKVLQRNRPNHALSRKQLEDIEVEEMKRNQVKARPINDKIFKPPSMDFSHRSLQLTEFKPFNLTEFKKKIEEPRPVVVKFTARPVPKGLFQKGEIKNTSAPSLKFDHSSFTGRLRVPVTKSKEKENKITCKPISKGSTSTSPFSFHDRDVMLLRKKQDKINQQLKEEIKMHEFHARPLPKFPKKPFQEKATIIPTIQQPFHLSADDKGKANKERWEKKVEEEKMLMKKAAEFKAKPPVILTKKPFQPMKSDHELKTLDIHLNTEIRAKERALYDFKMQMKQVEIEEFKKQRQRELEKAEEEEVARLRKEMIPKANSVRHYKEMAIKPAIKELTLPISPKSFSCQRKLSHSDCH